MLLVITYLLVVLGVNVGVVLLHVLAHAYHRCLHSLGHVYIGMGQHTLLRIALGGIEVTSTLFRAASLSLRVVCNATAGHVLLAVLVDMTTSTIILFMVLLSIAGHCHSSTSSLLQVSVVMYHAMHSMLL